MSKIPSAIVCAVSSMTLNAQAELPNQTIDSYILKYCLIAQMESFRTGIPTSIIMAQGILESSYGNSDLCRRSRNHFGIKWKGAEDGDYVLALDDEYKNGKRIHSKFVKYPDDDASFKHHSDILMSREHYRPLFKLERTDFVGWAYGLRACGYSTDKDYGAKLILLIRRYGLGEYDFPTFSATSAESNKSKKMTKIIDIATGQRITPFSFLKTQGDLLVETEATIEKPIPRIGIDKQKITTRPIRRKEDPKEEKSSWASIAAFFSNRFRMA